MLLKGEKAAVTKKYFVSLPTAEAHHQCHPTGREVAMAQRVHPKIIDKIYQLVLDSVTDPVQRHLKHFVCHSLCSKQFPDALDRVYGAPNGSQNFSCVTSARQRLLLLNRHSQTLLYTSVTFTENRHGKGRSRTTNTVSPPQMQLFSLILFGHVHGFHPPLQMRMPLRINRSKTAVDNTKKSHIRRQTAQVQ